MTINLGELEGRMKVKTHEDRLKDEAAWYATDGVPKHFLNRWPLYSQQRTESSYDVGRQELFRVAAQKLREPLKILVAPSGLCYDFPFIRSAWPAAKLAGLDIAPGSGPGQTHTGDILHMPFADQEFDLAVVNLFFHHVADEGVQPYLKEIRRVSKSMVTMEPSIFHPLFFVTRPLHKWTGNITKQVPHEHPISVAALARECRRAGFSQVQTVACSFAHNRIPASLRSPLNLLRHVPPLKHLAWLVGIVAS